MVKYDSVASKRATEKKRNRDSEKEKEKKKKRHWITEKKGDKGKKLEWRSKKMVHQDRRKREKGKETMEKEKQKGEEKIKDKSMELRTPRCCHAEIRGCDRQQRSNVLDHPSTVPNKRGAATTPRAGGRRVIKAAMQCAVSVLGWRARRLQPARPSSRRA